MSKEIELDDNMHDKLREILYKPHMHQYQSEYSTMIDHGRKHKFSFKSQVNLKEISDETSIYI